MDPFGRFATFQYDTAGRLERITDVFGLQSSFTYGTADIVKTLTTPYGTTTFTAGEVGIRRWAELADPAGGKERVQYGFGLAYSDPANLVPTGTSTVNAAIDHHNTLYWDRNAMALAPGEPSAATDYHWALVSSGAYQAASVPLSVKKPLGNRVWYNYKGGGGNNEGTVRKVTAIGRVLDDGTTQLSTADFNSRGQITRRTDPLGRETYYEYDANGLDLLRVKQKNGGAHDLLETRTYNSAHEPLTITDAAGQTTTYTYNARGQVETVTNAKNETTTYAYHATNGTLTSITGPVSGATTSFTYDTYGRLRTTTDADSYTVTMDYDAFDRPTRVTYPDSTYEETTYRYLNPQGRRDRLGRWTRFTYDAARRLTATRDPLGRVVTQEWCGCGSLEALVDPNGNRTAWERDLQGRVTREVRANGSDTEYLYETTMSRLTKMTDAKNQETNYTYFKDDQLQQITYTNAVITTPSVSFTYDPIYGRMATMADGIGTTTYGYHAVTTPPAVGATRLASVDGPLTNDTIAYSYDQLGRITTRGINGVGVTWTFDALGRLTTEANVLGTFTYTYDGPTARLATVTYPNGQTSAYAYYPNAGDRRLQTIHHKYPNATTLSKFDYTYDATGSILTWRQQADATAVLWEYGYDAAEQLVAAVKKSTDPSPVVLKRYAYAYDPAGNRTAEQIDDAVTGASYNMMNQLVSQQPSGLLAFEGTVSEPASVTIAGATARVSAGNQFRGTVPIASGVNTVAVTATDPSGNIATNTYELTSAGTAKTFTYDANGNLTSDGTRTFEWDARNQLVAVNAGTLRSEFFYDGKQRRVRIVGKESGVVQSDARMLWCGAEICEERSADGSTVTRNVFKEGEVDTGVQRFFALDHLGSPQAVTGGTGVLVAHYRFDPWGHRSLDSGSDVTELGFTRYRFDGNAQVWLSQYRAYDSALGRWLSQDPIGRRGGGPNLYQYVSNQPVLQIDPLGLQGMLPSVWTGSGPLGCATAVALDVFKNHRRGPIDDRYSHCLASCWISQHCGGEDVAKLAEAGKELLDVIQCRLGRQASCDSAEQPTDYLDNMIGRSIANACGEVDCLGGCKSLQGAGPGPPGPYGR